LHGDGGLPALLPSEAIRQYRASDETVTLKNGSEILFRSLEAENTEKLRGLTLGGILIDQAEELDGGVAGERIWDTLLGRPAPLHTRADHGSILPVTHPWSPYCVYTIRRTEALDRCLADTGSGSFTENKAWKGADQLLTEANGRGERMPIVFSAAEGDIGSALTHWARLTELEIDDGDAAFGRRPKTTYWFTDLTPFTTRRRLSDLRKKSDKKPLSEDFIRPYALCLTPAFIADTSQP
jgi:hypothetical protein